MLGYNLKAHRRPMCDRMPAGDLHAPAAGKLQESTAESDRFQASGRNVERLAPEQFGAPIQQRNAGTAEQIGHRTEFPCSGGPGMDDFAQEQPWCAELGFDAQDMGSDITRVVLDLEK